MVLEQCSLAGQQVLSPLPSLPGSLQQHCPVFLLAERISELLVGIARRGTRSIERVLLEEAREYGVEGHLDTGRGEM